MNETQSRPADSWKFNPANTAVVVVDMQNIWVHPRGARYPPTLEDNCLEDPRAAAILSR